MSETFFTADTHFYHKRIVKYQPNRGKHLDEMHAKLISTWNTTVGPEDDIWVLGDFLLSNKDQHLNIFYALNGRKHLIRGNHDHRKVLKLDWESIDHYREITIDGQMIVMSHYPFLVWNKSHYGSWQLHGHSHGNLQASETTRLDVGVDTRPDMAPYSFGEIAAIMSRRNLPKVDHHS